MSIHVVYMPIQFPPGVNRQRGNDDEGRPTVDYVSAKHRPRSTKSWRRWAKFRRVRDDWGAGDIPGKMGLVGHKRCSSFASTSCGEALADEGVEGRTLLGELFDIGHTLSRPYRIVLACVEPSQHMWNTCSTHSQHTRLQARKG